MNRLRSRAEQLLTECEKALSNTILLKEMSLNIMHLTTDIDLNNITSILMMIDNITYPVMDYNIRMESEDVRKILNGSEMSWKHSNFNNIKDYDAVEVLPDRKIESDETIVENYDNKTCIIISQNDNIIDSDMIKTIESEINQTNDSPGTDIIVNTEKIENTSRLIQSNCTNTESEDVSVCSKKNTQTNNNEKNITKNLKRGKRRKNKRAYLDDNVANIAKDLCNTKKNNTTNGTISKNDTSKNLQCSKTSSGIVDKLKNKDDDRCTSVMTEISDDMPNWDDSSVNDFSILDIKMQDDRASVVPKIEEVSTPESDNTDTGPYIYHDALTVVDTDDLGSNINLELTETVKEEPDDEINIPLPSDVQYPEIDIFSLPPQEKILIDNTFNCIITYAENPSSFYIIPSLYAENHKRLIINMNSFYQKRKKGFKNKNEILNSNITLFAIKGYADDMWCRATLKNPLEDLEDGVEMFCIDFGITITSTSASSVYPLHKDFYMYPPMAYHCCLDLIEPSSSENWKSEATQYMNDYLLSPCSVIVSDIIDDILCLYVLSEYDVVLNMDLVLKNIARFKTENNTNAVPIEPEPTTIDESDEDIIFDDEFGGDINIELEGRDINDEKMICKLYKGPPATTCYKGSRCKKAHIAFNPDGWTVEKVPVSTIADLLFPKSKCLFDVKVTTIINYKTFYMQFLSIHNNSGNGNCNNKLELEEFFKIDHITTAMNEPNAVKSQKCLKTYPSIGECISCKTSDMWVRGIVYSLSANDAEVFFIDYGSMDNVKYENMRELDPLLTVYTRQAIRCTLFNVKSVHPLKSEDAKKKLSELCFNSSIIAEIKYTEEECGILAVNLREESEFDVGETLFACEYVELQSNNYIPKINNGSNKTKYYPG